MATVGQQSSMGHESCVRLRPEGSGEEHEDLKISGLERECLRDLAAHAYYIGRYLVRIVCTCVVGEPLGRHRHLVCG